MADDGRLLQPGERCVNEKFVAFLVGELLQRFRGVVPASAKWVPFLVSDHSLDLAVGKTVAKRGRSQNWSSRAVHKLDPGPTGRVRHLSAEKCGWESDMGTIQWGVNGAADHRTRVRRRRSLAVVAGRSRIWPPLAPWVLCMLRRCRGAGEAHVTVQERDGTPRRRGLVELYGCCARCAGAVAPGMRT